MPPTLQTLLESPPGFGSETVGRFLWQMDEQRRRLLADTRGLTPEVLGWQSAPGMNTIGMLLAHIAYAENHLAQVGLEGKATSDTRSAIGISEEEEGMPLAESDLAREVRRRRPDGSERVFNVGWVLYHMLEHEAGHHAQIGLLRHLRRIAIAPRS